MTNNSKKKVTNDFKTFDTVIFSDYPTIGQKLWPPHCIMNSEGSQLHSDLKVVDEKTDPLNRKVMFIKKGQHADIDSYSSFFDNYKLNQTELHQLLQKEQITDLYICGLTADVSVGNFQKISSA